MSRADVLRAILAAIAAALVVFAVAIATKQPRHDRDWRAELGVLPEVTRSGDAITIHSVRDWRYDASGPIETPYGEIAFHLDDVRRAWFMMEPFPGSAIVGHTLVFFELEDDRLVALTIEARKEEGEIYSAFKGAFNAYELLYVLASARDLLTRRAVYLDHDVYIYPLVLPRERARRYASNLVATTEELAERPRFYNTFTSNCTNELARVANLDWHYAFILTGYSPRALYNRGLLPTDKPFEVQRDKALATEDLIALNALPPEDFDAALLARLRDVWGDT